MKEYKILKDKNRNQQVMSNTQESLGLSQKNMNVHNEKNAFNTRMLLILLVRKRTTRNSGSRQGSFCFFVFCFLNFYRTSNGI